MLPEVTSHEDIYQTAQLQLEPQKVGSDAGEKKVEFFLVFLSVAVLISYYLFLNNLRVASCTGYTRITSQVLINPLTTK